MLSHKYRCYKFIQLSLLSGEIQNMLLHAPKLCMILKMIELTVASGNGQILSGKNEIFLV